MGWTVMTSTSDNTSGPTMPAFRQTRSTVPAAASSRPRPGGGDPLRRGGRAHRAPLVKGRSAVLTTRTTAEDIGRAVPKRELGLGLATALVIGNMVGSGVFLLPASLASFGGISIVGWLFTAAGAFLLAYVFARMSRGYPVTGGPYAYSRRAFGDFVGFQTAWGYWIAVWAGNAAIAKISPPVQGAPGPGAAPGRTPRAEPGAGDAPLRAEGVGDRVIPGAPGAVGPRAAFAAGAAAHREERAGAHHAG